MYNGETIQFIGGLNEYIGVLDQTEHPNGQGWYRLKQACHIGFDQQKKATVITRLGGPKRVYRDYVDIYIPRDSLMEIRTLDKDGELYKVWNDEMRRPKLDRIVLPEGGSIQ